MNADRPIVLSEIEARWLNNIAISIGAVSATIDTVYPNLLPDQPFMKLYGHPDSGHVFKVRFCLEQAGIRHAYEVVDIWADCSARNPEFVARSRFCEVPLLVDEGRNLIQSDAILVYLARKFRVFGGESEQTLQACLEWLVWEANKIGLCLPQLRADRLFPQMALNPGAREWLLARYRHDIGVLDRELVDGRAFILGEDLSIADFSLCGYLMYADEAEIEVPAHVSGWLQRLRDLEGWQKPKQLLVNPAE